MIRKPPHPLLGHPHYGLVFNATANFSPALHFGCKMNRKGPSTYFLSSSYIPAIHTPALLDWTSSSPNEEVARCPTLGPPVILAKGTYVDMFLEGSTFTRDAFWALPVHTWMLAETESSRWHLLVQWLLWQIENVVRVYWDGYHQETGKASPRWTKILDSEFTSQKCKSIAFDDCATLEVSKLFNKSHFHSAMLKWFDALRKVGYSFPKLVYQSEHHATNDTAVWFQPVDFSSPAQLNIRAQKPYVSVANVNNSKKLYNMTCENSNRTPLPTRQSFTWDVSVDFLRPWHQFHDVLLVIIFNVVHYDVIPYLEILYRSFFPNILYCGPEIPDLDTYPQLRQYEFSFVTYDHVTADNISGSLNYECMIRAMRMRYQVEGYLAIADDLLLLINPLTNFPRNVVWYLPQSEVRIGDLTTLRECRLGMCDFYPHWHWWEDYVSVTLKLFRALKQEQWTSPLLHHCYSELLRLNGAEFRANGGYSDVYYIPSRLAEEFSELAQMFLREGVFLELAVPTIIRCLELPEDIRAMPGKQVWDLDRDQPWKYFLRSQLFEKTYLHPTKWSGLLNHTLPKLVSLYCDYVIPFLFDPYARFRM